MTTGSSKYDAGTTSAVGRHRTPEDALIGALEECMRATGLSLADFAQSLARQYHHHIPAEQQAITLPLEPAGDSCDDYMRWIDALRKQVQRFVSGDLRFPQQIAPAWIAALPEPYRSQARDDFFAHFGALAVPVLQSARPADLAALCREDGEEIQAVSTILADGLLDEQDLPHLPDACRRLRAAASRSLSILQVFERRSRELQGATSSEDEGDDGPSLEVVS